MAFFAVDHDDLVNTTITPTAPLTAILVIAPRSKPGSSLSGGMKVAGPALVVGTRVVRPSAVMEI